MDARVEDYLNDKIQTEADLDSLDVLIQAAQEQQALLRRQLNEANTVLGEVSDVSADYHSALQNEVAKFQNQQADIDARLRGLYNSGSTDQAVAKSHGAIQTLNKLDIARSYIELLQEVDDLSTDARKQLRSAPREALPSYVRLRALVASLKDSQPAADGAAPHLIDEVEQHTTNLWEQMRAAFGDGLEKTLERMHWPNKNLVLEDPVIEQWTEQVELLLDLQEPDLRAEQTGHSPNHSSAGPVVLLPLEFMVHPLELRFRYHFNGDKPTNRLDKPEYFLTHLTDLIDSHDDFLQDYFQPILDRRVSHIASPINLAYTDATTAFITALLPMVRQKCLNIFPQISDNARLVSHFIHELMEFDSTLRETWSYTPTSSPLDTWKGLTWEILVAYNYFNLWFDGERSFALDRYHGIIASPDNGEIDYDSSVPGSTKPTKGAIRVNDLLETITDRYRPLLSFSQKLRFLIDIQLEIFDQFHGLLHDSLEGYLSRTTGLGKALTGNDASIDLSGTKGLDRLCRVFGSAEYLEKKMLDWSDDVFFLELWEELQDRARRNTGTDRPVARDLSVAHIASKTSSAVTGDSDGRVPDSEMKEGGLFDETAAAYHRLRTRSEGIIAQSVQSAAEASLKAYSQGSTWSTLTTQDLGTGSASASAIVSPELTQTLHILDSQLGFLAAILSKAPLRRITRQLCSALEAYVWRYIVTRKTFSASGALTFQADVQAIWKVVDEHVGSRIGENSMQRLRAGIVLLSLPAPSRSIATSQNDDGWGFEDEPDSGMENSAASRNDESYESTESLDDASKAKDWNLWDIESRLFKSNDAAQEALRYLGLDVLSRSEARGILERRVELQK